MLNYHSEFVTTYNVVQLNPNACYYLNDSFCYFKYRILRNVIPVVRIEIIYVEGSQ